MAHTCLHRVPIFCPDHVLHIYKSEFAESLYFLLASVRDTICTTPLFTRLGELLHICKTSLKLQQATLYLIIRLLNENGKSLCLILFWIIIKWHIYYESFEICADLEESWGIFFEPNLQHSHIQILCWKHGINIYASIMYTKLVTCDTFYTK